MEQAGGQLLYTGYDSASKYVLDNSHCSIPRITWSHFQELFLQSNSE